MKPCSFISLDSVILGGSKLYFLTSLLLWVTLNTIVLSDLGVNKQLSADVGRELLNLLMEDVDFWLIV